MLDYERLDVYQRAIEHLAVAAVALGRNDLSAGDCESFQYRSTLSLVARRPVVPERTDGQDQQSNGLPVGRQAPCRAAWAGSIPVDRLAREGL